MMDVDLDQDLMSKFSSMGTTDRDVLINEFQKLLGNNLNPATCAFFLDMNNWYHNTSSVVGQMITTLGWQSLEQFKEVSRLSMLFKIDYRNLQAAIGSYYDIEANLPVQRLPNMMFVKDVTIGEGESVPPCTEFTKTWRVRNPASDQWPSGSCLRFIHGHQLGPLDRVYTEQLNGQTDIDISVKMQSPSHCGLYQGQWRMCTSTGVFFGETIWVIVEVKEGGMLGLTQQLSQLGTGAMETDSAPSTDRILLNPFGSPTKLGDTLRESTPEPPSFHSPSKAEHNSHLSSPVRPPLFQHDTSVQNPTHTMSEPDPSLPAVFHDYQLPHHHAPENTVQSAFPTNQSTASFSTLQAPNQAISQSDYTFHNLRPEDTMTDEDL